MSEIGIIDSSIEIALQGPDIDERVEQSVREDARNRGRIVAGTWLNEEIVKIRTENLDHLVSLLDRLHATCISRIREAISNGHTEGALLSSRINGAITHNMSIIVDELLDLKTESTTRDGIAIACSIYDSTRQQAISVCERTLRVQLKRARARSLVIESDITAANIVDRRLANMAPDPIVELVIPSVG